MSDQPDDFSTTPPVVAPSDRIGPYKLLQRLGEGGMGTVWQAEQTEPVRRTVAVKLIKADLDSGQYPARFEAERQALALMDHPNIAKVFDAGTTADGRPYFVMELVKGVPFTKYCDDARLTLRERLGLFILVCQAVQYAHQKGVIHRDLKPSNILVALYDGKPVPKVIDFGVAKALHQPLTEKTLVTELGMLVGSPEYAAPEQAEVGALDIDTRADIYSLGVILYELLTGARPFDRRQWQNGGLQELLRLIREVEPPTPSTRLTGVDTLAESAARRQTDPKQLARLVRGELDWIVMKCLEKERSRRYETANGLAMDVERYLRDEPVLARPPSKMYRVKKFVRRNKGPVSAMAIIFLSLVGGMAGTGWGLIWARQNLAKALAAEADTRAVNQFLTDDFLAVARPEERGNEVTIREALDSAAPKIERAFAGRPEIEASVRRTVGGTYLRLSHYRQAEHHLRRAADLYHDLLGPEHHETLGAQSDLASALLKQGRHDQVEPLLRQTRATCRRVLGSERRETLTLMSNLATLLMQQGELGDAEALLRQTLDGCRRALGPEDSLTLMVVNNLALVLVEQHQWSEAGTLLRTNLEAFRRVFGQPHPDTLAATLLLARVLQAQHRLEEAEPLMRECLEGYRKITGPDSQETLEQMHYLAYLLRDTGKREEAEHLFRQTLDICQHRFGPKNVYTLAAMQHLADLLKEQGKWSEAEPIFRELVQLRKEVMPKGRMDMVSALIGLGTALTKNGKAAEGEAFLRQALTIAHREKLRSGPFLEAAANSMLGICLVVQRRHEEAEPLLLKGYAALKAAPSVAPRELANVLRNMIRLYDDWGKPAEAAKWRRELEALSKPEVKPTSPPAEKAGDKQP